MIDSTDLIDTLLWTWWKWTYSHSKNQFYPFSYSFDSTWNFEESFTTATTTKLYTRHKLFQIRNGFIFNLIEWRSMQTNLCGFVYQVLFFFLDGQPNWKVENSKKSSYQIYTHSHWLAAAMPLYLFQIDWIYWLYGMACI